MEATSKEMHTQEIEDRFNSIDHSNSEIEDILDVLIFIRQEAEPEQSRALNGACVTLLYLARERLRNAGVTLDELRAAA